MKHLTKFLAVLIFLSVFVIRSVYPNEQENTDINFNISTNGIYYPGETINLNLYSYDYSQKKGKKAKLSFFIQVLKIKDLNEFYSSRSHAHRLMLLGRDSTNLTYLTEEYTSFNKNITMKDDYGYFYLSETIPISVTVNGAYVLKVTSGNKVAYCGFVITSGGIISKAGSNAILAYSVDRKTGVPVSNAELSIYIGDKFIGKGITQNGLFYQVVSKSLIQESTNYVYR